MFVFDNPQSKIALIGLGYVGLPIALAFAAKRPVIGFDINSKRLEFMRRGIDPCKELPAEAFTNAQIEFTNSIDKLREASFYIVAVPTPIDAFNEPDLSPLLAATRTVGKVLKKGDYVVFESTVYPGCTEEDCVPILEAESSLKAGTDFKVGYSPERINPGDKEHTLSRTVKIVSGCDQEALAVISKVYSLVVTAGLHHAPSIKVAEAAKIIENTQRDVNVALMNELSMLFHRMDINTYDVLEAARTKWNFLDFRPGLVGGHCIGVDPYYLVHKAHRVNYHPRVINTGRAVNDSMGGHIGKQLVKMLLDKGCPIPGTRVLVFGITFKENVADIRNSKVIDIIHELQDFHIAVDVVDPYAQSEEVEKAYGFPLTPQPSGPYDALVLAVAHTPYKNLTEEYFLSLSRPGAVFADIKGIYRKEIRQLTYYSL